MSDSPDINKLKDALAILQSAVTDCWSEGDLRNSDECNCSDCTIRESIREIQQIVDPPCKPTERYKSRLSYNDGVNCEAYFLKAWQKLNDRHNSKFGRSTALESILDGEVSWRDAEVVATVIQWMGTNVGQSFFYDLVEAQGQFRKDHKVKTQRDHAKRMAKHKETIKAFNNREKPNPNVYIDYSAGLPPTEKGTQQ